VSANCDNLQLVSRVDVAKTTYTLCEVLCSKLELASSSLTGRKSNAFKNTEAKEKLNENKVRAIVGKFSHIFKN